MTGFEDIKVVIRGPDGKYIAGSPANWGFTADRGRALVFDYHAHQVAEQLEAIRRTHGIALEAVPLAPQEIYETCDQCERVAMPFTMFFDGSRFLCIDCRQIHEAG
jgi:hypothetical protein